ncbi:MAG: CrcB family protein [Planctomycetota bacterium]|jgi:CrcB protein|nr:CrcB family protein [Planctomycetota bacterium]
MTSLYVAAGGALGALARYGVTLALAAAGRSPLWATLLVNTAGGGAAGWLAIKLTWREFPPDSPWRLFFSLGFLGAFTTFSAFASEAAGLWREGRLSLLLAHGAAHYLLSLAAVLAGGWLAGRG